MTLDRYLILVYIKIMMNELKTILSDGTIISRKLTTAEQLGEIMTGKKIPRVVDLRNKNNNDKKDGRN